MSHSPRSASRRTLADSAGQADAGPAPARLLILRHAAFLASRAAQEPDAHLLWQRLLGVVHLPVLGFLDPALDLSLTPFLPALEGVFLAQVTIQGTPRLQ